MKNCWITLLSVLVGFTASAQCSISWYEDSDSDGFGNPGVSVSLPCTSAGPAGHVPNGRDCNDKSLNPVIWAPPAPSRGTLSTSVVSATEVVVGRDLKPIVMYRNYTTDGTGPVTVRQFDGSNWQTLGADPIENYMHGAHIQLDNDGIPYIAFKDFDLADNTNSKATVLKYEAGAWVVVGSRRFSAEINTSPGGATIAFDNSNTPYIAIVNTAMQIEVMKLVGTTWVPVGGPFGSAASYEASIDIDDAGNIYVAFADGADAHTSVMKYNGSVWDVVGSLSFSDQDIDFPMVRVDNSGVPHVSYFDYGGEVVVQRFNGATNSWGKLGSVFTGNSSGVYLAFDRHGFPYVGYINNTQRVTVVRWTGASWSTMATGALVRGLKVSLAVGYDDDMPYVSFSGLDDGDRCNLRTLMPQGVAPSTPTAQATQAAVCAGGSTNLTVNTGALNDASSWRWYSASCGGTLVGSGETVPVSPASATTYYVRAEGSCLATPGVCSAAVTVAVNTLPTFTQQPADATVCQDASAMIDVTASGSGALSYQWYVDRQDGGGSTVLSGETANALTIPVAPLSSNQYEYRVRVTQATGGCQAFSNEAVLTVNGLPEVTTQPSATVSVCEGGDLSLETIAAGTSMGYQWYEDAGGGPAILSGQTNPELLIATVVPALEGRSYLAKITNTATGCETWSDAALVHVTGSPVITRQPDHLALCVGTGGSFAVEASGQNLTYQWQVDQGTGWQAINGEESSDLQVTTFTEDMSANHYRVEVGSPGCVGAFSDEVQIMLATEGCNKSLLITEGISPNGDGQLDYWIIQGIEEYPENAVKVFNVWGDLVYETARYNNTDKMWYGQSQKSFAGGNTAPDGTYYYIIDLGNQSPALRGFVVLKR